MLTFRRSWIYVALLLSLALLLVACPQTPAPETSPAPGEAAPTPEAEAPAEPEPEAPAEPETEAPAEPEPTAVEEPAAAPGTAAGAGTLRVALTTFPNSLDLPTAAEINASGTAFQLYDSLVWVDDAGNVVPALATDWEVSEDGTEYTFQLREGVSFHNGEPFNADSVVFSWERGSRDEMQWSDRWVRASAVEKVDDYTVIIRTEEPDPLLLRVIAANWAMVPPQYIEEVGEDGFNDQPVGTGPFMFQEWVRGDRIVFTANPDYWDEGLPHLDTLIFRSIPESSTRVAAIQAGDVDVVTRLSADEAGTLEGVQNVEVITYPVDRVYYIAFNNLTTGVGTPVEDQRVRLAMNHAVDRQAIIDALFEGHGRLSTGFVTPANLGYDESLEPIPYDPELARELLAEAGYPDGFEIGFACPAGAYTNFEEVCEAVQGYLSEVGIQTDLELMESGQYWDLEAAKELPPLFGDSWSEISGEALPRLIGALGGWDASFSGWEDETILDYLDRIGSTVDDEARAELYRELQRYMLEDPPFIYLYQPVTFEAINPRVQNYQPRGNEMRWFKNIQVSD